MYYLQVVCGLSAATVETLCASRLPKWHNAGEIQCGGSALLPVSLLRGLCVESAGSLYVNIYEYVCVCLLAWWAWLTSCYASF